MPNCRCHAIPLNGFLPWVTSKKDKPHFYKKSIWPTRYRLVLHDGCSMYKQRVGWVLYFNEERICARYSYWATVDAAIFILFKRGVKI